MAKAGRFEKASFFGRERRDSNLSGEYGFVQGDACRCYLKVIETQIELHGLAPFDGIFVANYSKSPVPGQGDGNIGTIETVGILFAIYLFTLTASSLGHFCNLHRTSSSEIKTEAGNWCCLFWIPIHLSSGNCDWRQQSVDGRQDQVVRMTILRSLRRPISGTNPLCGIVA